MLGPLRFHCTQCGVCCRKPGCVFFNKEELESMASFLELRLEAFVSKFDVKQSNSDFFSMEAKEGGTCPLLSEDNVCLVQPVKPQQCRSFPFWDELLDDKESWQRAASECEGIDHPEGQTYHVEDIERIRNGQRGTFNS